MSPFFANNLPVIVLAVVFGVALLMLHRQIAAAKEAVLKDVATLLDAKASAAAPLSLPAAPMAAQFDSDDDEADGDFAFPAAAGTPPSTPTAVQDPAKSVATAAVKKTK